MKYPKLLILAIGVAGVLTSCSDEPKMSYKADSYVDGQVKQQNVNDAIFADYISGKKDVIYRLKDISQYNLDELTNGKWEKITEDMVGGGLYVPGGIKISEGKVCSQVISPSIGCCGAPTFYNYFLKKLNSYIHQKYEAIVARPVTYDPESRTLSLGGQTYNVVAANRKGITLSKIVPYAGGRTHNGGHHLQVGCYEADESVTSVDSNIMKFENDFEAYEWLIAQYREHYYIADIPEEDLWKYQYGHVVETPSEIVAYLRYYLEKLKSESLPQ